MKMKAKLQKQLAYKYKEKNHYKFVIVVPDGAITELGWKGGQGLGLVVRNGKLIVSAKNEDSSVER